MECRNSGQLEIVSLLTRCNVNDAIRIAHISDLHFGARDADEWFPYRINFVLPDLLPHTACRLITNIYVHRRYV